MALTRKIPLNASRAEVWEKIATGPGLSSWFVPFEVEEREGGFARGDFGGETYTEYTILVYDPERRIVFSAERVAHDVGAEPDDEPDDAILEFWITDGGSGDSVRARASVADAARRGARSVLNFRQRGFPEEDQVVYEAGWDVYFHTLTEYFKHFSGRAALTTTALVLPPLNRREGFARMVRGLGLGDDTGVGRRVQASPRGQDAIDGVIDIRLEGRPVEALGIRTETGFIRATMDDACGAMLNRYTYVVNPSPLRARNREEAVSWQGWLEEQLST